MLLKKKQVTGEFDFVGLSKAGWVLSWTRFPGIQTTIKSSKLKKKC